MSFGPLTVAWGPNDAGKSTTLRRVHDALDAAAKSTGLEAAQLPVLVDGAAVELTCEEADRLARGACERCLSGDSWPPLEELPQVLGEPIPRERVSAAARRGLSDGLAQGRALEAWIEFWFELAELEPEDRDRLSRGLLERPTLLLRPLGEPAPWLEWCLDWTTPDGLGDPGVHSCTTASACAYEPWRSSSRTAALIASRSQRSSGCPEAPDSVR